MPDWALGAISRSPVVPLHLDNRPVNGLTCTSNAHPRVDLHALSQHSSYAGRMATP